MSNCELIQEVEDKQVRTKINVCLNFSTMMEVKAVVAFLRDHHEQASKNEIEGLEYCYSWMKQLADIFENK